MDISTIFNSVLSGITGITADAYTVIIAALGCLLIAVGVGVVSALLLGDHRKEADGGVFSETEFQEYAVKRYKTGLYERTYKTRGIGTHVDMGGDRP